KQSKRMRESFIALTCRLSCYNKSAVPSWLHFATEIKLKALLITTVALRGGLILLAEFCARSHVEILLSNTTGARGIEVEACAVARQCGTSLCSRRIDRGTQVHRRRPGIARTCPRRDPEVERRLIRWVRYRADTIRGNEHFQPVMANRRTRVTPWAA